jgi:hypothetical protein
VRHAHLVAYKNPAGFGGTLLVSREAPRWVLNKGSLASPCFFCKDLTPKGAWYVRVPSMGDPVCADCCDRVGMDPRA